MAKQKDTKLEINKQAVLNYQIRKRNTQEINPIQEAYVVYHVPLTLFCGLIKYCGVDFCGVVATGKNIEAQMGEITKVM